MTYNGLPGWSGNLTVSNICDRLADAYGDAAALYDDGTGSPAVSGNGTLSYRGLRDATNRLAFALIRHHDLKKGERIIIACENQAHALTAFLSVVKAGGVAVPLPLRLPPFQVRRVAEVACPALVITDYPRHAGRGLAASWTAGATGAREVLTLGGKAGTGSDGLPLEAELESAGTFFFPYTMKSGDVMALYFSERGDGLRGTMIANRSLLGVSGALCPALRGRRKAGGIVAMGLHEIAGLAAMLSLLRAGVGFTSLKGIKRLTRAVPGGTRNGVFVGPPEFLEAVAGTLGTPGLWICPRVLDHPPEEMSRLAQPGRPVLVLDGPVFDETCGWALLRVGAGWRGRVCSTPFLPLLSNRYRVGLEDGDSGGGHESGRLRVKGKAVTFGYWGLLEESLSALRGRWFDTGLSASRRRLFGYDLLR